MTDLEKQQISELIKQAKEGNQLGFMKSISRLFM